MGDLAHATSGAPIDNRTIARADRSNTIIVIYSHGSTWDGVRDSCGSWRRSVPSVIRSLHNTRIDGKKVIVHRRCTHRSAVGRRFEDILSEPPGREKEPIKICQRAAILERDLEQLVVAGFPPRHIFMAGHSAGAWLSLQLKAHRPGLFNGVIALAPAGFGQRENRFCTMEGMNALRGTSPNQGDLDELPCSYNFSTGQWDPIAISIAHRFGWWRRHWEQALEAGLRAAADGTPLALAFQFHCDPFEWPDEIPVLLEPALVQRHLFPAFPRPPSGCRCDWASASTPYQAITICHDSYEGPSCPAVPPGLPKCKRKRPTNCPTGFDGLCRLHPHKELYTSRDFNTSERRQLARDFIERRVRLGRLPVDRRPRVGICD